MFFQRVANWLAQEVIVKGLAESVWFQRVVLRTHTNVEKIADTVKTTAQSAASHPELARIHRSGTEFISTFQKTFQEELGKTSAAAAKKK